MFKSLLPQKNFFSVFYSALIVFVTAMVFSYIFLGSVTDQTSAQQQLNKLGEIIKGSLNLPPFGSLELVFFLLIKNLTASAFALVGGLLTLGIIPIFTLIINGAIIGFAIKPVIYLFGADYLLASLIPHGIIELPAFFLAASVGLYMGIEQIKKWAWKRPKTYSSKTALKFFFFVVFPLLLAAAFIEVYITPIAMSYAI
ncbi:stage II sporulation protein M [Desulfolucanica intricata]|uniref:stage II sporulation protein M n=1 Tax=Desulfolucanica intricata TaxID=1285191 RepID=UPI00082B7316|nr:stage II sporulation protein M [Desulfolucanica intricata]